MKLTAPWERTQEDYLKILSSDENFVAGEYDNTSVIFDMIKIGVITLKEGKNNRHDSMVTSLHLEITPAGRQALKGGSE